MKINVGNTDRILRIAFGAVLIGLTVTEIIGAWGWIGVIPLITGFMKSCPVYSILGTSTCATEKAESL